MSAINRVLVGVGWMRRGGLQWSECKARVEVCEMSGAHPPECQIGPLMIDRRARARGARHPTTHWPKGGEALQSGGASFVPYIGLLGN